MVGVATTLALPLPFFEVMWTPFELGLPFPDDGNEDDEREEAAWSKTAVGGLTSTLDERCGDRFIGEVAEKIGVNREAVRERARHGTKAVVTLAAGVMVAATCGGGGGNSITK